MNGQLGAGLANVRREVLLLLAVVAVLAVVVLALSRNPPGQPLCTFTGGLGDDPIPAGYEHCFQTEE